MIHELPLGSTPLHGAFSRDLAPDGMLDLMERERGIPRDEALALASVAVDLRVTQVVNLAVGVHAVPRDDALR